MRTACPTVPFVVLPRSKWTHGQEIKKRFQVEDLVYSSGSDSDDSLSTLQAKYEALMQGLDPSTVKNIPSVHSSDEDSDDDDRLTDNTTKADKTVTFSDATPIPFTGSNDFAENHSHLHSWLVGNTFSENIKSQLRKLETYRNFQSWRSRKADSRRHHLLRHYESKVMDVERDTAQAIETEIENNRKALLKIVQRRNSRMRNYAYKKSIMEQVSSKLKADLRDRTEDNRKMDYYCINLQRWDGENQLRKQIESVEAAARARAQQVEDNTEAKNQKQRTKRNSELVNLKDDLKITQSVLKMMRATGTAPGANAPPAAVRSPQNELARHLDLYLREDFDPTVPLKAHRSKDRQPPFTVDVLEYRNVISLQGYGIGERGALFLGADMVKGACSRLETLNLSRCNIATRGFGRLLHGIRIGNLIGLTSLILQGNNITPRGIHYLKHAIEGGALTELKLLNLDDNEVSDEGSKLLAHALIAGLFKHLMDLSLRSNGIGDSGFSAITKGLISVHDTKCPYLDIVRLQQNNISSLCKWKLYPLPSYINL